MASSSRAWGTCAFCGDPYPPNGPKCPTCGHREPVPPEGGKALPTKERRHLRWVQGVRLSLVIGAIVVLSYLMITAAFTPPAAVSDPLTTSGSRTVGPGNYTVLSGDITGDDYVVGNYSVSHPLGANVTFLVFNDTDYTIFAAGGTATPLDQVTGAENAPIVFSAPYTDTFHFVWINPYSPASGITLTIYIDTSYESNALVE